MTKVNVLSHFNLNLFYNVIIFMYIFVFDGIIKVTLPAVYNQAYAPFYCIARLLYDKGGWLSYHIDSSIHFTFMKYILLFYHKNQLKPWDCICFFMQMPHCRLFFYGFCKICSVLSFFAAGLFCIDAIFILYNSKNAITLYFLFLILLLS